MVSKPIDWTFFRINYFEKSSGYILVLMSLYWIYLVYNIIKNITYKKLEK